MKDEVGARRDARRIGWLLKTEAERGSRGFGGVSYPSMTDECDGATTEVFIKILGHRRFDKSHGTEMLIKIDREGEMKTEMGDNHLIIAVDEADVVLVLGSNFSQQIRKEPKEEDVEDVRQSRERLKIEAIQELKMRESCGTSAYEGDGIDQLLQKKTNLIEKANPFPVVKGLKRYCKLREMDPFQGLNGFHVKEWRQGSRVRLIHVTAVGDKSIFFYKLEDQPKEGMARTTQGVDYVVADRHLPQRYQRNSQLIKKGQEMLVVIHGQMNYLCSKLTLYLRKEREARSSKECSSERGFVENERHMSDHASGFSKLRQSFWMTCRFKLALSKVSCGTCHILALSALVGKVYGFGDNSFGQIGKVSKDQTNPCEFLTRFMEITEHGTDNLFISCNFHLSAFVKMNTGTGPETFRYSQSHRTVVILTLGCAPGSILHRKRTKLRLHEERSCQRHQQTDSSHIAAIEAAMIHKICCGENHVLVLVSNGDCYSYGDNSFGQTASPFRKENEYYRPYLVNNPVGSLRKRRVIDASVGRRHSLFLVGFKDCDRAQARLYVSGTFYGEDGQLRTSCAPEEVGIWPEEPQVSTQVLDFGAGTDCSAILYQKRIFTKQRASMSRAENNTIR